MDMLFLGTCACEPSPRFKTELKDSFDMNVRRTSAALLRDDILLDAGKFILDSIRIAEVDTSLIKNILITHLHRDHFDKDNVAAIAAGRSEPIRIFVREDADVPDISGVEYVKMTPFKKYEVDIGVFVTGLPANHAPDTAPQHLLIEADGKKIFYGGDGAWMLHDSFKFLSKAHLDIAVFDCTCGDYNGDFRAGEHNSIPMLRCLIPSLGTIEAIDGNTLVYATHLAPKLHATHDKTVELLSDSGINVAFDGLRLDV